VGSTATITPTTIAVQPGGQGECELRVRNTGRVVDQFSFEALGAAAPWITFEPASVKLYPNTETDTVVRIICRPPQGSETPAGPCAVGVRVRSKEDPRHPTVEEFTLDVGRLHDTFAEVLPRTSQGRRRAVHTLAVDNRGNTRLNATLSAADPDDRLRFAFQPTSVVAEPGAAAFARLTARPVKTFLRGASVTHPFRVQVQADDQAPLVVDGTMLQEPLIPRWAPRALVGFLALALVGGIFWQTVLKKDVKATAKEVAEDTVEEALRDTAGQIGSLTKQMADQQAKLAAVAPAGTEPTPEEQEAALLAALGEPFDDRLAISPDAQTATYTVPADKQLSLTDVVLQNPDGDSGRVALQRGTNSLLVVRLENFRDLDYHFVTPVVFGPGQILTLQVTCENADNKPCTPAAYYSGFLRSA
jgi:hypothetical protein